MKKILFATAIAVLAVTSQASAMESLSQYAWKNRVLILFGTSGNQKLASQVQLLKGRQSNLAARDMVVISVIGDEIRPIYGNSSKIDARQLRREADITSGGFQAVLVGKDGGIKLRSQDVITDATVFGLIDRMPMSKSGRS
ncbi:DUF4174 domain-containing protein [Neorhizobium sp. NCHU2750]|uniref:DUF4174 domain-containing protein n=1 Tax=Neorhizobium sp. NCHU2750 TaxID=1825976 RepID=UPI000E76FFD4|nr:hypothetical protein NCHU2750_51470 [Neorhizobium sp. NCHU2750]